MCVCVCVCVRQRKICITTLLQFINSKYFSPLQRFKYIFLISVYGYHIYNRCMFTKDSSIFIKI